MSNTLDRTNEPQQVLTRQQLREVDRRAVSEYGMTGLVLMENAGRGAADRLRSLGVAGPVVICCGKGNNAGDGFVIARHLDWFRIPVRVCVWGDVTDLPTDAATNWAILTKAGVPLTQFGREHDPAKLAEPLTDAAWVVDALLGTGARGEPREPIRTVIDQLNQCGLPIFAVDLPSGLDCDAGVVSQHTIRAAHTATFVAAKPGFHGSASGPFVGQCHVIEIGVPRRLVELIAARS